MLDKYREEAKLVTSELEYDGTIRTFAQMNEALLILSACSLIEYTRAWNSSFFFVHEHTEIKLKINLAARSSRPL